MPSQRIVVGVDGSPGARSALLWAADEASLRRCGLLVAHAPDDTDAAGLARAGEPGIRSLDQAAEQLLRTHVALGSARQPAVPVTMLLSHANAADALIDQSHDAQLLVVGTRGCGGITMSMLGSVSHRVAAHAYCPVAVVPEQPAVPTADGGTPRVVVGASDTRAGRMALDFALGEAHCRSAVLQAVHAHAEPDAERFLEHHLAQLCARYPTVTVEKTSINGEPAEALLREAQHAQLVVVGCQHSNDRWSTRLGPVPVAILHSTSCPVIVVGAAHHEPASRADAGAAADSLS